MSHIHKHFYHAYMLLYILYDSLYYVTGILAILVILQLAFVIKMSTSELNGSYTCNNCTESTIKINSSMCNQTYCTDEEIRYILQYLKQYELNKQLKDLYPCTTSVTWSCTATLHPNQPPLTHPPCKYWNAKCILQYSFLTIVVYTKVYYDNNSNHYTRVYNSQH